MDTIANLLTRIRNAERAKKESLNTPYSKIGHEICKIMVQRRFLKNVEKAKGEKFDELFIELDLDRKTPLTIVRVSKPGQRIYRKAEDIKVIKSGLGIEIISTSKGIMTNGEAFKANIGGEVLCLIK